MLYFKVRKKEAFLEVKEPQKEKGKTEKSE